MATFFRVSVGDVQLHVKDQFTVLVIHSEVKVVRPFGSENSKAGLHVEFPNLFCNVFVYFLSTLDIYTSF